jgi:hypothetical protein
MSLRYLVTKAILDRGCGRIDQIEAPLIAHGFTQKQIRMALHNAKAMGYLWCERKKPGEDPVYWPGDKKPRMSVSERKRAAMPGMVNSVFAIANPKPASAWPEEMGGTIHRPMGPWHSEEAETA